VLNEVVVAIAEREREGQKFHVLLLILFVFFPLNMCVVVGMREERSGTRFSTVV